MIAPRATRVFGFMFLAIAVGYTLLRVSAVPARGLPYFAELEFQVVAHRGGAAEGPENTLHRFLRALADGANVIEMDVRSTADGEFVVIHDATLERTTDGSGSIAGTSLAELQRLDAAYHWSPDGGRSYPLRGAGIRVPTLAEVFTELPAVHLNIELKGMEAEHTEALCTLIRAHHGPDRVMVASFDDDVVLSFRDACPEVATSATYAEARFFYVLYRLHLTELYSPSAEALQVPRLFHGEPLVTERLVAAAHARNLRIIVWTVDDPRQMRELIATGVDGIITDRPRWLSALVSPPVRGELMFKTQRDQRP